MPKKEKKQALTPEEMVNKVCGEISDITAEAQEKTAKVAEETIKPLVDEVVKRTEKWAEKNNYNSTPKKESKLSTQGEKVQEYLLTQDFGCHNERVAKLCSLLLNEPVRSRSASSSDAPLARGACVVPLSNNNGNNYVVGLPVITFENGGYSEKHPIRSGNSLTCTKACLRPATRLEIASLLGFLLARGDETTRKLLWELLS